MAICFRIGLVAALTALAGCAAGGPPGSASAPAPEHYVVGLDTSAGPVVIDVTRADAPRGADRLYHLVRARFFDGARFFRVVPGFVAQFGIAAEPALTRTWNRPFEDDPVKGSNVRGTVVFAATSAPDSRTTQLFINLGDNARLDEMGFVPVGRVTQGMDNVDRIYSGYGDTPDQGRIETEGNAYLAKEFPKLDYIKSARILY